MLTLLLTELTYLLRTGCNTCLSRYMMPWPYPPIESGSSQAWWRVPDAYRRWNWMLQSLLSNLQWQLYICMLNRPDEKTFTGAVPMPPALIASMSTVRQPTEEDSRHPYREASTRGGAAAAGAVSQWPPGRRHDGYHRWSRPGLAPMAVCANGAVVYDAANDRVVSAQTLSVDQLAELAEIASRTVPGAGLAAERGGPHGARFGHPTTSARPAMSTPGSIPTTPRCRRRTYSAPRR